MAAPYEWVDTGHPLRCNMEKRMGWGVKIKRHTPLVTWDALRVLQTARSVNILWAWDYPSFEKWEKTGVTPFAKRVNFLFLLVHIIVTC